MNKKERAREGEHCPPQPSIAEVLADLERAPPPDVPDALSPADYERTPEERELAGRVVAYWRGRDDAAWACVESWLDETYSRDVLERRGRAPARDASLPFARLLLAVEDMLASVYPDEGPAPERLDYAHRLLLLARLVTDADFVWRGLGYAEGGNDEEEEGAESDLSRAWVLWQLEGQQRERFYALVARALEEAAAPVVLEREEPKANDKPAPVARALGILTERRMLLSREPDAILRNPHLLSISSIARAAGCARSTLHRSKSFMAAVKIAQTAGATPPPRGWKTKDGELEAWRADE